MWMVMGLMGLLVASSMADALIRLDNDDHGADGANGSDGPADEHGANVATRGDLLDSAAQDSADPWLDEWHDDGFTSGDDRIPDEGDGSGSESGDNTGTPPDHPAGPMQPDPWLDSWRDDSFVSSDAAQVQDPDDADLPDKQPPDGQWPDTDSSSPHPVDPWLDGWRDTTHVSSDIPQDLAALAGGAHAIHVLGAGELFDTGGGSGAFVIGDWIGDGNPAIIRSFDPMTDRLIFAYDASIGAPQIAVQAGSNGTAALLMIDTQPVLALEGLSDFDAASVLFYPIRLDT